MGKLPLPKPERKPQGKAARRRADPEEAAQLIQGLHKLVTAFEALVKSTKHFETEAVRTCADTRPGASVPYVRATLPALLRTILVPETTQGSLPPRPLVL